MEKTRWLSTLFTLLTHTPWRRKVWPRMASAKVSRPWLAACHPEFRAEEDCYVNSRTLSHAPALQPRGLKPEDFPVYVGRLKNDAQCDKAILDLLERVGPFVLGPTSEELARYEEAGLWADRTAHINTIRLLILARLEAAFRDARAGATVEARSVAAGFLKGVGSALTGDRRGKREKLINDPVEVLAYYYRRLFRWEQARALMPWPCKCSLKEKIARVAEACALPAEELGTHLMNTEGQLKRPISPDEQARIATCQAFGVNQPTLSNLLFKGKHHSTK